MNNLTKRILSAIILAPSVLYIIYIGGIAYNILLIIATLIMMWEWCRMTQSSPRKHLWWFGGILYIGIPVYCLHLLSRPIAYGEHIIPIFLLMLIASVWSTDIGAYIAGKIVGGPKIAPTISPNKTWAGLIGGMFASSVVLVIAAILLNSSVTGIIIMGGIGAFLAVIAQIGDFFESWVKRKFNVKDSSNIIPGHGGLLDRVDGLLSAAPVAMLMLWLVRQH